MPQSTVTTTAPDTDHRTFAQLLLDLGVHLREEQVERLDRQFRVYLACQGYNLTQVPLCTVKRHLDGRGRLVAEEVNRDSLAVSEAFERACQCATLPLTLLDAMTRRFVEDLQTLAVQHRYPKRLGTDLARGILANYWQQWSRRRFYDWAIWLAQNYTDGSTRQIKHLSKVYQAGLAVYDELFRDYCGFSPRLGAQ
ncbi:hypothetical protein RYO59_002422 [Thermosynechococcaceae cyanobacterium Okahandja]